MLKRYTLKSGIPLFIVENHAAPVVSVQAWVTRGSAHESDALAGISHYLEHAVFKGTRRRKVGEVAAGVESRGGEINAFTSFEETAFYTTLASRYFEQGLDIISDIVQNPIFDKEEMEREKEVILEEIKRAHDSPYKMVSMNLWQASFPNTPYGRPVLGFQETVRKISNVTLRRYFEQNYHNRTLSVFIVGDVDSEEVFQLVQKKFQKVKHSNKKPVKKKFRFLPPPRARAVFAQRDLKECHVQIGWVAPPITHPSIPSIDLLCSTVGQGESSRLHQRLVKETRLAMEAHMALMATADCGLLTIGLLVAPEKIQAAIEEAMKVVADAVNGGLENKEIERIKSSLESDVVYGKETVEGYARRLGYYYCQFGDPEYEKKYLEQILAVEKQQAAEQLQRFYDVKPILSVVHPLSLQLDKDALLTALQPKAPKTVKKVEEKTTPVKTEKDSVTFLTKECQSLPTIAFRLIFRGGSREEDESKLGLGTLFQRMWAAGTTHFSSLKMAQTLESLGASVHAYCGRNTLGVSVEFLSKHWPLVKPVFQEILLEPTFPEEEFITEKNLLLREILAEKDSPGQLCHQNFLSALYPKHPYGRSSLGTQATVEKLSIADLKDFYRNYVHRKQVVVSSVGDFETGNWNEELRKTLSALPTSGKAYKGAFTLSRPSQMRIVCEKKEPLHQSHLLVGFHGASFKDPERYALKLLSSCLSGQGGRLFLELRDKQSLAYSVSPMNSDSPETGMFGFYIGCSPEKWDRALRGIRIEIEKILQSPMSQKELERAKEFWIGRFELEMQRYSAQSILFGLDEIYGLGYRHYLEVPEIIKGVSAEEIQAAAQKYLTLPSPCISIVHGETLEESRVRRAWDSSEKPTRPIRLSSERTADGIS